MSDNQQALENLIAREFNDSFCGTAELMKECLGEDDSMLEAIFEDFDIDAEPSQIICHKVGRLVMATLKQQMLIKAEQELIDYPLEVSGRDYDQEAKDARHGVAA